MHCTSNIQDKFFDSLVSTLGIVNQHSANSKKHFQLSADSNDPNAQNRGTFINLENVSFFFLEILKTLLDNIKIVAGMSPLSHCGDKDGRVHWIVFMASFYMYCTPCFMLIEHSAFHETMSDFNVFMLLSKFFLSTLLVLALTMRELHHRSSIASMSPQSHFCDEEDSYIELSS